MITVTGGETGEGAAGTGKASRAEAKTEGQGSKREGKAVC